jgi:hypothetical protein
MWSFLECSDRWEAVLDLWTWKNKSKVMRDRAGTSFHMTQLLSPHSLSGTRAVRGLVEWIISGSGQLHIQEYHILQLVSQGTWMAPEENRNSLEVHEGFWAPVSHHYWLLPDCSDKDWFRLSNNSRCSSTMVLDEVVQCIRSKPHAACLLGEFQDRFVCFIKDLAETWLALIFQYCWLCLHFVQLHEIVLRILFDFWLSLFSWASLAVLFFWILEESHSGCNLIHCVA